MKKLGIPMPLAADYPECLTPLLKRRIWRSTLGELVAAVNENPSTQVFFKPADDIKAFSGEISSPYWL